MAARNKMPEENFFDALEMLSRERGIPVEELKDRIKKAIESAVKKDYDVDENRKVEDEVMTNAVGGTEGATVVLFKVGERVVYISTAQVGRIREVYPNEKDLSNSR